MNSVSLGFCSLLVKRCEPNRRTFLHLSLITACLFGFNAIRPVDAAVIYFAAAGSGCYNEGASGTNCAETNLRTNPPSADVSTAIGSAVAGPSGVGSSARVDGIVNAGISTALPQGPSIGASAGMTLDDVVISAVSGPSATSIDASLNLLMRLSEISQSNGVFGVNLDQYSQTGGNTSMTVSVYNDDFSVGYNATVNIGRKVDATGQLYNSLDVSGDFPLVTVAQLLDGTVLATPLFGAPVGTPFSLDLLIASNASLTMSVPSTCNVPPCSLAQVPYVNGTVTMDALDTFGFSIDGPVFNLPDGFTANSASGLIVNNRWVIPSSGPVTSVPEPATLPLLVIGLLSLGWLAQRRHRILQSKIRSN